MSSDGLDKIIDLGNSQSVPSFFLVHEWIFPTVKLPNPQDRSEGEQRFSWFLQLRTSDYPQYYSLAATTICFYDFFLTLADEVSHAIRVSLR